jgi:hypothetical protein
VSHTTLRCTLAASAELSDEISAARSRAALEPLACVIRESKRSWRAATWLLKYLDERLKNRDTPRRTDRKRKKSTKPSSGRTRSSNSWVLGGRLTCLVQNRRFTENSVGTGVLPILQSKMKRFRLVRFGSVHRAASRSARLGVDRAVLLTRP